jgi:hypothetical protein
MAGAHPEHDCGHAFPAELLYFLTIAFLSALYPTKNALVALDEGGVLNVSKVQHEPHFQALQHDFCTCNRCGL